MMVKKVTIKASKQEVLADRLNCFDTWWVKRECLLDKKRRFSRMGLRWDRRVVVEQTTKLVRKGWFLEDAEEQRGGSRVARQRGRNKVPGRGYSWPPA